MSPKIDAVGHQPAEATPDSAIGQVRRLLEELVTVHQQTVQQERLRAFREMAGEVAHDFNNTLSGVPTCAARSA